MPCAVILRCQRLIAGHSVRHRAIRKIQLMQHAKPLAKQIGQTLRLGKHICMGAILPRHAGSKQPVPFIRFKGEHLRAQPLLVEIGRHLRLRFKGSLRRRFEEVALAVIDEQHACLLRTAAVVHRRAPQKRTKYCGNQMDIGLYQRTPHKESLPSQESVRPYRRNKPSGCIIPYKEVKINAAKEICHEASAFECHDPA